MTITVKQPTGTTFVLNEDMSDWYCDHAEAYIEAACCTGRDSDGNMSCGCHGVDSVACAAVDCTGIRDEEIDDLFDRLRYE